MDRHSWCSTNSGILVEKEVTVHIDHNGSEGRPRSVASSVVSVICPVSDLKGGTRSPVLRDRLTLPPPSDDMGPGDMMAGPRSESPLSETKASDSIQYLVELFRQPPPESCMSEPDYLNKSSLENEKWKRFRPFRKERKHHTTQPNLILPDSAIPAKTMGGHKHIAISIPSEYSYLDLIPGSKNTQDSVSLDAESRHGLDRRFSSSDYSTAMLPPVAEDHSSPEPISLEAEFQREIERRFSSDYSGKRLSSVAEETESITSEPYPEPFSRATTEPRERPPPELGSSNIPVHPISEDLESFQVQGTGLYQEVEPQKRVAPQRLLEKISEESEGQSEGWTSAPNLSEAEIPHLRYSGICVPSSSEPSIQQPLPSELTCSPQRSDIEGSKNPSSSPPTKIKMVPPPQFLIENGEAYGYTRTSLNERLLLAEPLPDVFDIQTAGAARKISPVIPPPREDDKHSASPTNADSMEQTAKQVDCTIKTEKSDEAQEGLAGRRRKAKVERIKIRLRPESMSDSGSQDIQLVSQIGCTEPIVQSHASEGLDVHDANSSPLVSNTSKVQEEDYGEPNDGSTTGQVSIQESMQGCPSDKESNSNSPSPLPASPSSPANHMPPIEDEEHQQERLKGKDYKDLREAFKSQSSVNSDWLSRQEIVSKLENLRESHLQDMDKRIRRLERHNETWIHSMVPLMENLNKLLEEQNRLLRSANAKSQGSELGRRQSRQERQLRAFDTLTTTPSPSPPAPGQPRILFRRAHSVSGVQFHPHRRRSASVRLAATDCSRSSTLTEESQTNFQDGTPRNRDYHEGIVEKRRTELEERIGRTGTAVKTAVEATTESVERNSQHHQKHRAWPTGRRRPAGSGASDITRSESRSSSHSRSTSTICSSDGDDNAFILETDEDPI